MKESTQTKEGFSSYTISYVHAIPEITGYRKMRSNIWPCYSKNSTTTFRINLTKALVLAVITQKMVMIMVTASSLWHKKT